MSDTAAILIAVVAIIPSSLAAILSFLNGRKIEVVRNDVNSKMTEMQRVIGEAERAKGVLEGIEKQKSDANGS